MSNAPPSVDPANLDSLTGAFRHIVNKMMQATDGSLPARVISFDRNANRAEIQPLIAVVSTTGEQISRAQIASIPVVQLGGGGYLLNFNLKPGDLGWIIASDRDISLFLQSYKESSPNTFRMKNFADSWFLPAVQTGFTIAGEDSEHAVLQSLDGSVRIALWPDQVKITAPTAIVLDSDVMITKSLTVVGLTAANGGITATNGGANSSTVTGNLRVVGNITASGDITAHVP